MLVFSFQLVLCEHLSFLLIPYKKNSEANELGTDKFP